MRSGRGRENRGRAIWSSRAGTVALLTALCAPLLLLIVGFGIDYGYASYINQRLAKATDSAVLAAVSQSAATAGGGYGNTAWLKKYGTNVFWGNIEKLSVSGVTFNLSVTVDGTGVIASGSYSYASPTFFAGVIGMSSIPLGGNVQSIAHPVTYLNYYILTDTSQSMGIAATQADMQALYDRVVANNNGSKGEAGCIFACHIKAYSNKNDGSLTPYTNEDLAHNVTRSFGPRIALRIDSAVSAMQSVISSAQAIAGKTKNIKIGLYTIREDDGDGSYLGTTSNLSSDYATLSSRAATIGLGNTNIDGRGGSNFTQELSTFNNNVLLANGSGASATSPLNYVFIVTDGLKDAPGSGCKYSPTNCFGTLDPADCNALKAKATVGVIYTTYIPVYNKPNDQSSGFEALYDKSVNYFGLQNQIVPALQSCATSSDYYFEAKDGPELVSAMQALFLKTQPVSARLTQ